MKRLILFLFALGFVQCTNNNSGIQVSTHTDANGYTYETVSNDPTGLRLYTLDNGLKVYLSQNNDEPKIQTLVGVRAGSVYDPADNTGLAHYLEHMLFKGTSNFGTQNWEDEEPFLENISKLYEDHKAATDPEEKKKIYQEIDRVSLEASQISIANEYDKMVASLGAEGTNAGTSNELTVYMNKIPSNQLDKWLTLEKERFSQLVLRLFHTELEAVYEEFNRSQDNDGRKIGYALMDALFPTHPYGQQTTIGKAEHLKNPSMVAIHNYFDTYYVPNNMAVILVGDLDFDSTIQKVDASFGSFEKKELTHPQQPQEQPISAPIEVEVFGPDAESVQVAFRTGGVGSEDQKYMTLIDMLMSNSTAGLLDLNLNQQQKVQRAGSYNRFMIDYGMYTLNGRPKQGQSLEEVKDLMLEQLENIKSGNFDEWLIDAVINDMKLSNMRGYEDISNVAYEYLDAYISFQDWSEKVAFMGELRKISKADLVAYANEHLQDNYVVAYKRQGESKDLVKVENPGITPVALNRDKQSKFIQAFNMMPAGSTEPVFVDFASEIQKTSLANGLELAHIENKTNDLAELYFIFDMGSDHMPMLSYAFRYFDYLGTSELSAEEVKKEFYKLGISLGSNVGNERTTLSLSGLRENMGAGVQLLNQVINTLKVDQEAYDKYIETIAKARKDNKSSKQSILWTGLRSFAQYGENSRLRNNVSLDTLKSIDPQDLVSLVQDIRNYQHRMFYYGKDLAGMQSSLEANHPVETPLKSYPEAKTYTEKEPSNRVYFANYDMVQAELILLGKGQGYDPQLDAATEMYNSYFGSGLSSIVFQELRESQSLAYSAFSIYSQASDNKTSDYLYNYIGTQANKIPQAVGAMQTLLEKMPEIPEQFEIARQSAIQKLENERITKADIFWTYERLQKRGLDYDTRKDTYTALQQMQFSDLESFFNNTIKNQKFDAVIVGNRNDVDLNALSQLGQVQELDIDYLFNY